MEELLNLFDNSITEICTRLEEIARSINKPDLVSIVIGIISIIIPVIATFVGIKIGNKQALENQKREFCWNCYIDYLNIVNKLISDINCIIISIRNLENIIKKMNVAAKPFTNFENWNDYKALMEEILYYSKGIEQIIDSKKFPSKIKLLQEYMNIANDILALGKIPNIIVSYQLKAAGLYPFINSEIEDYSEKLCNKIEISTSNEMKNFDICNFKKELISYKDLITKIINDFKINNKNRGRHVLPTKD